MLAAVAGQSWAVLPHPYNLEVDGTDWIDLLVSDSLRIEMPGPGSNGSMSFTLYDPTAAVSLSPWQHVTFTEHAAPRPRLFGGFAQSVRIGSSGAGRTIEVECAGYGILLDRRLVISEAAHTLTGVADTFGNNMVGLVNRYGGIISALGYASTNSTQSLATVDKTVECGILWYSSAYPALSLVTLRGALDRWAEAAVRDYPVASSTGERGVYWVDSCARLHLVFASTDWEVSSDGNYLWDHLALYATGSGSFGGYTGPTAKIESIDLEYESTDRVTSVYVSGTWPGTMWRSASDPVAGDMVSYVSSSAAADEPSSRAVAQTEMAGRSSAVRGSLTFTSSAPVDVRTGQGIRVESAAAGVSTTSRIASVEIRWLSPDVRTYSVGFGGIYGVPSLANRSGRFATR